jgi:glycosyltransferase involved in cell wall biosynthesis
MTSVEGSASTDRLKVLMVAPTSFFKDYGGHIRIYEEANTLQKQGHSITIATYNLGDDLPGLTIRRTKPLPYHADYEVGSSRHKLSFDLLLLIKTLQVAWEIKPDIVHGHMHEGSLIGGVAARLLKIPLIFDFQGSLTSEMVDHGFLKSNGLVFSFFHRLEKIACRRPAAILTSSEQAVSLLEGEFGVDSAKIHPLPDCVDTERFNREKFSDADRDMIRAKYGIPENCPVVIYLGLLADYQGTPEIIKTAAVLKEQGREVFFLIMGFPKADIYQKMANDLGLQGNMKFTGKVEYRNAARNLAVGDIAISAKVSSTEGSGKVLNYMAMSIPVVAFDTVVHREYLGELGVYAPVGDVRALASGIERLIADPVEAKRLGTELNQRVKDSYSWEQAGKKISELYQRLTNSS